jgi:hypothetical protein
MIPSKVINPEFLLWSQLLLLWSFAAYGVAADPLSGENTTFPLETLGADSLFPRPSCHWALLPVLSLNCLGGCVAFNDAVSTTSPLPSADAMARRV